MAAALGRERALRREIRATLRAGVRPARLDETLLQLVPFAGFARAINAFSVLREFLPKPAPSARRRKGYRRRGVALCRRMIELSRTLDGLADRKQTS